MGAVTHRTGVFRVGNIKWKILELCPLMEISSYLLRWLAEMSVTIKDLEDAGVVIPKQPPLTHLELVWKADLREQQRFIEELIRW